MNRLTKSVPDHLRFLMWVYLSLIAMFTLFRAVTLLVNRPEYLRSNAPDLDIGEAFLVGFRFDILVASYTLLLPYLLLTASFLFSWKRKLWVNFSKIYCTIIVVVCLIISAADVPYFNFFNSRLTTIAVNWQNLGQSIHYIVREIKYYPFIIIGLLGIFGIRRWISFIWKQSTTAYEFRLKEKFVSTGWATFLMLLGLFGGATPKIPTMEAAIFTEDGFVNQLTLNPVQTWFDSFVDFNIEQFSLEEAQKKVRSIFKTKNNACTSPLKKDIHFEEKSRQMNVVLVLMESMSMYRMGIFTKEKKSLTPFLDSLARKSVFFDRCYSNGIHTNAGLYSTLFGFPVMLLEHPMYNGVSEFTQFSGLPATLQSKGYQTIFFCTHPKSFDNLGVFMTKNGFDEVSDLADYPADTWTNSWGVPDETLFKYAHQKINKMAKDPKKPFFATILTITAHPPYTFPPDSKFKPHSTDPISQCYEYADWSIQQFIQSVRSESWYKNTIFVFAGDHGTNLPGPHDVPLSYNHIPLIIHCPKLFPKPKIRHDLANQTDIFPTVMGLLRQDYTRNTMGFDLFREKRPYAIFSQDTKLGVIDDQHLFIARKSGKATMFNWKTDFGNDILPNYAVKGDSMMAFACAQLQVARWMVSKKLTSPALACDTLNVAAENR